MLKDVDFRNSYSSGYNEPKEFFTEALIESKTFDLGLGFFSTSGIRSLAYGFAVFVANGGTMRVVINDILNESDKRAILIGQREKLEDSVCEKIITNIEKMKQTFSQADELFFRCFSYLISIKRMEFIATLSANGGLAHDKYGVFSDNKGNKVAFIGSANFSQTALEVNSETVTVFTSWKDKQRVTEYQEMFNKSWEEDNQHVVHIPIERVKAYVLNDFKTKNTMELIKAGISLRDFDNSSLTNPKPLPKELIQKLEKKELEPRFPFPEERDIQKEAYKAWKENSKQGIFAMATGSGKTVTALNCLLKEYQSSGIYKAIIVVPTKALALQWENEVKNFNFQNVISTHTSKDWKKELSRFTTKSLLNPNRNLILITTYATFIREKVQEFVNKTNGINDFVFIADEAHNLGARGPLSHLPTKIRKRIGLSATPERVYDEVGSKLLYEFFNSMPPKYTYRFTMKQAIDKKILCPYNYHPIFVSLTNTEMAEYAKVTDKLRKFIDPETGKYKKEAEMLLMKRKRIVHKAQNKKLFVAELLDSLNRKRTLDYTFVFVPEGYEPDYAEVDNYNIKDDDIHIIDEYASMFKDMNYRYHKYITGLEDAPGILDSFAKGDIQVLLSMKCLDEGVDIPRAEHAIFISSTGNPRQFIQRRGRVLRRCEGKEIATIWDLIVTPPDTTGTNSTLESNLFKGEVKRIINFAALAENKIDILYGDLHNICMELNIDMFKMLEEEQQQYNN